MKHKWKFAAAVSLILTALLIVQSATVGEKDHGFYRVSGQQILGPDGEPVVLRGMNFDNGYYATPNGVDDYVVTVDHSAESYMELAAMGLNHVRFEFNYHLFESDDAPYAYKEDGFELIDRNLEWAKAAGLDLILQLKWPQGGYQTWTEQMLPSTDGSGNGGKGLWLDIDPQTGEVLQTENYKETQNRIIALWTEIARRYADEPAIIGYNLFNEPVVPQRETKEETVAQVQNLMQDIADGIRTVDSNHILFVEGIVGWFDPSDPALTDYEFLSISDTQYLINDDNTVYEFHFYEPYTFTHQGATWLPQYPAGQYYPSYEPVDYVVEDWTVLESISSSLIGETENGWKHFQSEPFTAGINADGQSYNFVQLQAAACGLGAGECAWYDDLTVTRTDSKGNTIVLYTYDFSDSLGQFAYGTLYDENGTAAAWDAVEGHDGVGSLCISESVGNNWADIGSSDWFPLGEGYSYQISGWVKSASDGQYPQVTAVYADNVRMADRAYVEQMLGAYCAFGEENGVPLYVGEWGVHSAACDYGYESYIKDVSELLLEYGLGSSFFAYHDEEFGMYLCGDWENPTQRNETLYALLVTYYGKTDSQTLK